MIRIERLAKVEEYNTDKHNLKTGEFYECIESPDGLYNGWVLYVVNITGHMGKIYGSWLNKGRSIFGDMTGNSYKFRFKKLTMKLVEVKE